MIPLLFPINEDNLQKVYEDGFQNITPNGTNYGKGYYFSSSLSSKSTKFLLCCLIPGNAYPITKPSSSNSLASKGCKNGYQSHCVLGIFYFYFFFKILHLYWQFLQKKKKKKVNSNDESIGPLSDRNVCNLIIFQQSQILPVFYFETIKSC